MVAATGYGTVMRGVGFVFLVATGCALFVATTSWKWWWRVLAGMVLLRVYTNPTRSGLAGDAKGLVIAVVVAVIVVLGIVGLRAWSSHGGTTTNVKRGLNPHVNSDGRPKRGYVSKAAASAQAARLSAKDGARVGVYQCGSCSQWHVGHSK